MYKYWGFGLNIESEIEFPELLKYEFDIADVVINFGNVPEKEKGEYYFTGKRFSYSIFEKELLFVVFGIAKYYAFDGKKIIIEPEYPISDMRGVRLYVLATVMAAILMQRRILPIHASAIKKNNELVLISGQSHVGKSTTLAGLLKKGYNVFSDDVVVVRKGDDGVVKAAASYPMVKLWDDTIDKLDDPLFEDCSFRIKKDINKYGLFFHQNFDKECYPVKKVFVIKIGSQELTYRELKGRDAFTCLVSQVYRPVLLKTNELKLLCFTFMSEIVKNSNVIEITRPVECNVDDLIGFVESLL